MRQGKSTAISAVDFVVDENLFFATIIYNKPIVSTKDYTLLKFQMLTIFGTNKIENRTPINCRQSPKFSKYFDCLWKELGVDEK